MEAENWSVRVLVDAKTEYTKQLLDLITPRFYEGFLSLYDDSKRLCEKKQDTNVLITFQQLLRSIPKWNRQILETEYARIINKSNCDFLEDLITAIFVANTKILTAIKTDGSRTKRHRLNLSVPNGVSFIHKCYVQVAREFWRNPYLFDDTVSTCDIQRNMRDCYSLIDKAISESIRKQLPVRHILKEYLGEITEDDHEDDDIESIMTNSERKNLKRMVEADIRSNNVHARIVDEDLHSRLPSISSEKQVQVDRCDENLEEQLVEDYQNYEYERNREGDQNNGFEKIEDRDDMEEQEPNVNMKIEREIERDIESSYNDGNDIDQLIDSLSKINDTVANVVKQVKVGPENIDGSDLLSVQSEGGQIAGDNVSMVSSTKQSQSQVPVSVSELEPEPEPEPESLSAPAQVQSQEVVKSTPHEDEIKSIILQGDISRQDNRPISLSKGSVIDNLSDTSSSDMEEAKGISEMVTQDNDNKTIKTVTLQLVNNPATKRLSKKKPRNLEYAFYD